MKLVQNTAYTNQNHSNKKENTLKKNLYLIEFYVKDPVTGEGGYDINFAWVYADSMSSAENILVGYIGDRFDETIQVTEQSEIRPFAGSYADFTGGVNLFIIGSPADEMTDEEFVEDMRTIRLDHLPDGYPAVQTRQIDRLIEIIDKQQEQMAPNWSKKLPSAPGWYWSRPCEGGKIIMGEIWNLLDELYFGQSAASSIELRKFTGGEWCGPLVPPK